jgi:cell division protein FtsB
MHFPRARRRKPRSLVRWALAAGLCLFALAYYKPAKTYFHTRHTVASRQVEVDRLRAQNVELQRLVAASEQDAELAREARRLGFVKPNEQLFIVKGIERWLRTHGGGTESAAGG